MSEQVGMTDENKKTIIAFIIGLVIGGILVYVFANPAVDEDATPNRNVAEESERDTDEVENENDDEEDENDRSTSTQSTSVEVTGEGSLSVNNQPAGNRVAINAVTFPTNEGWIGVRDYVNGQMTGLLGVARWNVEGGLTPNSVNLLRSTVKGNTYAVVFYKENGDRVFNLATDAQMSGVMETFEAQ